MGLARLIVACSIFLAGCAHVMSEDSMKLVDRHISFEELRKAPESYVGRYVLFGGTIAGVKNTKGGAELEVLQTPLGSTGTPEETQDSGGRFIVSSHRFLDPLVYRNGRRVSVVGEVKGKKLRMIDEVEYVYPFLAEVEMHLWESLQEERRHYPPPYYYDPFWDPWWPYRRPFYPYWW